MEPLEVVCFLCMVIGLCLPVWSVYAFKDIEKFRTKGQYPSVEIRDHSFLIFSTVIWCICLMIYPLFIYLMYFHHYRYPYYSHYFNLYVRLILYSFQLFGILSLLIVKICKLYYNINKLIDDEKWFCCHIIDKYWTHSFYIINYQLLGRSANLLLFSSVYFSFAILMITFISIVFISVPNNILIEYITLFIISTMPIIGISYIYRNIKHNTKYFVDDHFLLKEILILIIIYFINTLPSLLTTVLIKQSTAILLSMQIISNTISCSLAIIISLRFGVWAALNRQHIIKHERNKLANTVHPIIDHYQSKYEQEDKRLSGLDEIISNDELKSLQLEMDEIDSESDSLENEPIPSPLNNAANKIKWHYVHLPVSSKTNKARTPTANIKMFARLRVGSHSHSAQTMSPLVEYRPDLDGSPRTDRMEKIFFKDLLNFRFGFYCFSQYLHKNMALNNLAFIAELTQFKKELDCELSNVKYGKKKLIKKKYEWMNDVEFKFLPRGDCYYINQNNIVFHAWNVYIKYITDSDMNKKPARKAKKQSNICITKEIAYKVGEILESIYQHYQFLYSQKKYYLKYQKNKKNILNDKKYCELTQNMNEYESKKNKKKRRRCYFNRYVSVGSFGNDNITIFGDGNDENNIADIKIDVNIPTIHEQQHKEQELLSSDYDSDRSVTIHNIEVVDTQQTPDHDFDDVKFEILLNDLEEEHSKSPFDIDIEPLRLELDKQESDVLSDNYNVTDDEDDNENEPMFVHKQSDTITKISDIWSVIENETQISVEASTLNDLYVVFDDAEYMIWDLLLEYYEKFKIEECDQYLMCRYKLRSSQKNYIRQKNNQKIKTPRNRYMNGSLPFWKKTKSKSKPNANDIGDDSAFNYDYTNIIDKDADIKNKIEQIEIVDASQI